MLMLGTAIVTIFLIWWIRWIVELVKLPPGPWGLPIVGYLPWIGKKVHLSFVELGKDMEDFSRLKWGSLTVVVLNDWTAVKATFVDQPKIFSGRPFVQTLDALMHRKDIGNSDGAVWRKQRNLLVQCLRNVGMGKKTMENHCLDIVLELNNSLSLCDGEIIPMQSVFFRPILRGNWRLITGHQFDTDELKEFEVTITELFAALGVKNLVNIFPWLRFVPPDGFGLGKLLRVNEHVTAYLKTLIDRHLANCKEGLERDLIDYHITEIKRRQANRMDPEPPYNVEHLLGTIWDLFFAGILTTNSTCLTGFLHLAYHPEVQDKARDELNSVVGRNRLPTLDDFSRLPYVKAVLMEIHRVSSVLPLSIPHCTTQSVDILGYTLPKGSVCFQNIYAIHHDPHLWEEPHLFKPERFLNHNNQAIAPPYLIPFSTGPRQCPSQPMAEMELKLIFSCLLHKFKFSLPNDRPKPTLEQEAKVVLQPYPYSLLINVICD